MRKVYYTTPELKKNGERKTVPKSNRKIVDMTTHVSGLVKVLE